MKNKSLYRGILVMSLAVIETDAFAIYSRVESYCDAGKVMRRPGDSYEDAGGVFRAPGNTFEDYGGVFRSPTDAFEDFGGVFRKRGVSSHFQDGCGVFRRL